MKKATTATLPPSFFFLVAALQRSEEGDGNGCDRLVFFLFFFFLLKHYSVTNCRGLLPLILLPCSEAKAIDRATASLSFGFAALECSRRRQLLPLVLNAL